MVSGWTKTPVTEEDYQRVAELHALGMGRNAIAREIGRAQRTVSVIAQALGLVFDTTMTEEATKHRLVQLAEKRTILADALVDDALKLTEQVWAPAVIYNFGGKDNTYEYKHVDEPPALDKKNLMASAGIAIEKSLRLVPPADDSGTNGARSMVGDLITGLTAIHRAQQQEAEQTTEDEGDGDAP